MLNPWKRIWPTSHHELLRLFFDWRLSNRRLTSGVPLGGLTPRILPAGGLGRRHSPPAPHQRYPPALGLGARRRLPAGTSPFSSYLNGFTFFSVKKVWGGWHGLGTTVDYELQRVSSVRLLYTLTAMFTIRVWSFKYLQIWFPIYANVSSLPSNLKRKFNVKDWADLKSCVKKISVLLDNTDKVPPSSQIHEG